MTNGQLAMHNKVKAEALRLGFSHCGIARNDSLETLRPFLDEFIAKGHHAGLKYLETHFEKRLNPSLLLESARSVITVLLNYYPPQIILTDDNYLISKYAYGKDYHDVMRSRMKQFTAFLKEQCGASATRAFVDSGVVLEKAWAQRCGVGWQGKNTLIINREGGSFFFIGILLTDLVLPPDPPETDHCGSCTRCVDACPTGALDHPYRLDISRCISYLTIETSDPVPEELRSKLGDHIYGCDRCQDVCPYNRFAVPHNTPEFLPSETLVKMRKKEWQCLTEAEFHILFEGSPLIRSGFARLKRLIAP